MLNDKLIIYRKHLAYRAVLSVCFYMDHFVMVPLNLNLSTLFATFLFDHLFNLYKVL